VQAEIEKEWKHELENRKPVPWPEELKEYVKLRRIAMALDARGTGSADNYAEKAMEELEERLDEFPDLAGFIEGADFNAPADVWTLPGRYVYPRRTYEQVVVDVLAQFENDPIANDQLVAMHKQFIKDETHAAGGIDDTAFDPKDLGTSYWDHTVR